MLMTFGRAAGAVDASMRFLGRVNLFWCICVWIESVFTALELHF